MPPRRPHIYETHVFSLPSAFGVSQGSDSQNSNPVLAAGTSFAFNSHTGSPLQKPRRRANTMPWNQGPVSTFGTNFSQSLLDFRPVLYSPQTPLATNSHTEQMDIEMEDIRTGIDSTGDEDMDGNFPYLSNRYMPYYVFV